MTVRLDALDRKILTALQQDATRPLEELAALVGSSKTPVWNRIRKLKERGVVDRLRPFASSLWSCRIHRSSPSETTHHEIGRIPQAGLRPLF